MRRPRIARQERVGAEHDGGIHPIDQLRHRAVVQGRGIEKDAHAEDQRQYHADGEPERMEHRQHVEHFVLAAEIDAGGALRGVRQHVAVGEHDALGHAFRAGREQDRGPIVGLALDQRFAGVEQAADLIAGRDAGANVLEIDDLDRLLDCRDQVAEPALLDEDAR